MKSNIGALDKAVRVFLAIIIGALGLYNKSWWGLLALIPFVTVFIGFCPLYAPFGISTKKK